MLSVIGCKICGCIEREEETKVKVYSQSRTHDFCTFQRMTEIPEILPAEKSDSDNLKHGRIYRISDVWSDVRASQLLRSANVLSTYMYSIVYASYIFHSLQMLPLQGIQAICHVDPWLFGQRNKNYPSCLCSNSHQGQISVSGVLQIQVSIIGLILY